MKLYLAILLIMFCIASCKKETRRESIPREDGFPVHLRKVLTDSLTPNDFMRLDFKNAVATRYDQPAITTVHIPFRDDKEDIAFLLLELKNDFSFQRGRIIELEAAFDRQQIPVPGRFQGHLRVYSLSGAPLLSSPVVDGYILSFHPALRSNGTARIVPSPIKVLPEVVVTSYYQQNRYSWATWIHLLQILGYGGSGYYSNTDGGYSDPPGSNGSVGGGNNGNNGNSGNGNNIPIVDPYKIDFEYVEAHKAIDMERYLSCFKDIPDEGAVCTIELFTDIPVDGHPEYLFHWENQSPGHVFINISKSGRTGSVSQNIGFYPIKTGRPF